MYGSIEPQSVLLLILYLVLILVGVYYVTRFVAKVMGGRGVLTKSPKKQRQVSVVDRIMVDKDKSIIVIQYGGKEYLIGASAQSISVLESREIKHDEAYPENEGSQMSSKGYASNLFEFYLQKFKKKSNSSEEGQKNEDEAV